MKLVMLRGNETRVCDWERFALLRDNVQHFLEQGQPSQRFRALHAIETALDEGASVVSAVTLRGEVLRAWGGLWNVELRAAAISLRTRAIATRASALPGVRGTLPARLMGWELPVRGEGGERVPRTARPFIQAVFDLTAGASPGDVIEIRRAGELRPPFADLA